MKGGSAQGHALYVEGRDDEHVIRHLLMQRGFDSDALPEFKDSRGKQKMLNGIPAAIGAGTDMSLGFVLDANDDPGRTWQSVITQLGRAGVHAPDEIPEGGFTAESEGTSARVGVWLMPDNRKRGALEDFLQGLIDGGDRLLPLAENSASKAKHLGARFSDRDALKAILHTWLAWQKEPGLPYGTAIRAHYFEVDSPHAEQFVAWFQRLFRVTATG